MTISFCGLESLGSVRYNCSIDCYAFAHCVRPPPVPEGKTYPGAELILTPPATPEPVLIDEGMVSSMLNKYKSHFPTDTSESRKKS